MRIEAQGKYLQKIIEEQEKLGGVLKASEPETSNTWESTDHHSVASQSSPRKKQKTDDVAPDCVTRSSTEPPSTVEKTGFMDQWDRGLFGLDSGARFKERDGDGSVQNPPLELDLK